MFEMRYVTTLVLLALCAYTDIKERNIYILPVLAGSIGGVAISVAEKQKLDVIILALLPGVIMITIGFATGWDICLGDGLLCVSIGLLIGMRECVRVVIYAMIFAGIFATLLLMVRKSAMREKTLKERIPFVPFILSGFLLRLAEVLQLRHPLLFR